MSLITVLSLLIFATDVGRTQTIRATPETATANSTGALTTIFVDPTQADPEFGSRGTDQPQVTLSAGSTSLGDDQLGTLLEVCWNPQNETREDNHSAALERLLGNHVTCVMTYVGNFTDDCPNRLRGCELFLLTPAGGLKCDVDDVIQRLQSNDTLGIIARFHCNNSFSLFRKLLPLWIVLILLCVVMIAALLACVCCFCRSGKQKPAGAEDEKNLKKNEKLKVMGSDNPALEYTHITEVRASPDGNVKKEINDHQVELSAADREIVEQGIIPFEIQKEDFHLDIETEETRM